MKMVFTLLLFTMGSGLLPQRNFALQNKFSISFQTSNGISGCAIQLKSPDAPETKQTENAPVIIAVDEKENKVSSIYPNPNDGTMRMDYELKEGQKGELVIYDLTGRIVKRTILNNENNSLPINLTLGVYYYTVNLNGEKVLSDKLIIIK